MAKLKYMIPSIRSNYISIGDLNVRYLSAGSGSAILLLHGWPTSSYLWRNIIPELAKNNQVIALDLPGFGKSDKNLKDSFSFKYYGSVIDGLLEKLNIEKVTLVVHDLGGPIGLHWMVRNLERIDRLALLNTLVYPQFSWGVKLFALATIIPGLKSWLTSPGGIKKAMNFGVYKNKPLPADVIRTYQEPFTDSNSRKVLLKSIQRLNMKGFHEIAEKLRSFKGPVQILYGEMDRILPKVKQTMERVKKDLPQAKVLSLPECGHFLQEDSPEIIAEVLSDFMKDNPS